MSVLADTYKNEIMKKAMERFKYANTMEIPRLVKVVVNMGVGEAIQNIKALENSVEELKAVTGQKPIVNKAKRSIAGFKLREGMPIGTSVTLRRDRMYDFLYKLINVALPRVRDFKGVSRKSFDGRGNYNLGIKEQIIFPEIDYEKVDNFRGLSISIITTAKTDEEAEYLLECFGMPFTRKA